MFAHMELCRLEAVVLCNQEQPPPPPVIKQSGQEPQSPSDHLIKLILTFLRTASGHEASYAGLPAHCSCDGPVLPRLSQQVMESPQI